MKKTSEENKKIAVYLRSVLGGTPHFRHFIHDNLPLTVDLLWTDNQPEAGLMSHATIGLSDTPLLQDGEEFPTRVELLGVSKSDQRDFGHVLGSVAFDIMRSQEVCPPGSYFEKYVAEYFPKTTVPHAYLTAPFVWQEGSPSIKPLKCSSKLVNWLLLVPISTKELDFLKKNGDDEFEDLLQGANVDIYDLRRRSSV